MEMKFEHWHIALGILIAFIVGGMIAKFTGFIYLSPRGV
jgi:hypothetical protein